MTEKILTEEEQQRQADIEARAKAAGIPVGVMEMHEEKQFQAATNIINGLEGAMRYYDEPRSGNEVDIVSVARQALIKSGVAADVLEKTYDKNPHILEAAGRHAHAQQFQVNQWAVKQCFALEEKGKDTRMLRYSVMNEARVEDWITVFEKHIAPNLAALGLQGEDTDGDQP